MTYKTLTWHMWNMFPSFSPPKSSFTSSTISPNELLWLNFSFHGSFVQIRKTRSRSKFCIQMYFWMNELVKIDDLRRWLMKEGSCKCPVIKVSAHCQTDQSFSDPLSEFLLLQSTEIAVSKGAKKRIRRPCLCVVSGQLGTHSINHSRHTFTVNMLFTHKGIIFSTRSFCVLPRYLCILTWAHKCWKRKSQSVVGCFHFCWESSETWWAASFLAPCSRHTEQLPPHD